MAYDYELIKEEARQRQAAISRSGRDIGHNFPPVDSINWERRNKGSDDLLFFLSTYFPASFTLEFSDDHIRVIRTLERIIREGGLQATAMPRGNGKTVTFERAALWGLLYGYRRYIALVAATQDAAEKLLLHIKTELSFNPLLAQDFPSVCYPIQRLENNAKRCSGQLYHGQQTLITWTNDRLVLPHIDRADSKANGSVITTAGLTGNLRGQSHTLPSGEILRPELVLVDDPQTRESAASVSQTQRRLEIITGDLLGMAGPNKTIAAQVACTVIYQGDLSSQLLDRAAHPEWQGEKTKLLYQMPTNDKLWDEYKLLRDESFRNGGNGKEATDFYKTRQEEMDAGAVVGWKARFNPDEISAVQYGMNLYLRDAAAFAAEYQNEPLSSATTELELPKANEICERTNNYKRGVVPVGCQWITGMVDVQGSLLYYTVLAVQPDFTTYVIDYGCFPDQHKTYYTLKEAKRTLQTEFPPSWSRRSIMEWLRCLD